MDCTQTLNEMLRDRGYDQIQNCHTIEEMLKCMSDQVPIITARGTNLPVMYIFFHNEERIGVKHVRSCVDAVGGENNIVLVSLEGPTSFTRKEAENQYTNIQFFLFRQICVNITHHKMVPFHEKLTKEEALNLPYETSKDFADFPRLYSTDPIAQYYSYQVGDMIRITRTIGVHEPMYFYRIVCSPIH